MDPILSTKFLIHVFVIFSHGLYGPWETAIVDPRSFETPHSRFMKLDINKFTNITV